MQSLLDETWAALERQTAALTRKTESLRQLARTGMAAMAGALAGAGLLLQAGAVFSLAALILLATGLVGVLLQAVATGVSSRAARPTEVTIGPDLMDIYRGVEEGWTAEELRRSLLQAATVAQRYNGRNLELASRRIGVASTLLCTGAGCVLAGMAFVAGGAILA